MSSKRISPRFIKIHRSYSVEDIARTLNVHKNSVRSWIKSGMPTVDNTRPILVLGSDLKLWLETRRKANKRPCKAGTIYCFKCREPKAPALGMIEYKPMNSKMGNLNALCEACGTVMHRRIKEIDIPIKMPDLEVQIREAPPSIIERAQPSLNCDYK